MTKTSLLLASLLLAGCGPQAITLVHPETGRQVRCDAPRINDNAYGGWTTSAYWQRGCVEDFQRQGYERAP